ncbi:MAG: hypothetical protein NTY53_26080 [Kiritimatiellaeota bacterium]|nr:hypothetical protein [Kiritimatiellota bacterium]
MKTGRYRIPKKPPTVCPQCVEMAETFKQFVLKTVMEIGRPKTQAQERLKRRAWRALIAAEQYQRDARRGGQAAHPVV